MDRNHVQLAVFAGTVAALAVLMSGCGMKTAQTAPIMAVPVTVAKAVQKTIPIDLSAIGSGEAYSTVSIKSQVNAELEQVHFTQGDFVTKGQLLFSLDARPFEAALNQAQATLARDKAQAELDEVQAQRYQKLFDAGVTPKEQFDQMKATADAQEASVHADEAASEAARLQLQYCSIYSPIDGRTGALGVTPGNLVKQNDVPVLVVIAQITPLYVDFAIPEQYLGVVKEFMAKGRLQVEATPYGDTKPEVGYLTFIDNSVDNTTGTIKLKATFANADHRLWPGQFSTVSLRLSEQENATVVPSQAVQTGQSGDFVFVVTPESMAEQRAVKVSRTIGGDSVISQGVKPGETVVTDGQLRLIPGIKVAVRTGSGIGS
ncbi:MAG: efflux RND transporter periplasmic adaptor subunit [Candidatus Acidiferrales bacterium]